MITFLLATVLIMADPVTVFDITWDTKHTEKQVKTALPYTVVLSTRYDSQQRRWRVALRHKGSKYGVRTKLQELPGVTRVRLEP